VDMEVGEMEEVVVEIGMKVVGVVEMEEAVITGKGTDTDQKCTASVEWTEDDDEYLYVCTYTRTHCVLCIVYTHVLCVCTL